MGERLGAQSQAPKAQDKFNSNRSVGPGGNLVPGLRGLLARAWSPASDSCARGRLGPCVRQYPGRRRINDLFLPGGEASPQRELWGPTLSAEILQVTREAGRGGQGPISLTFPLPGSPYPVAGVAAGENPSLVLGESCGGGGEAKELGNCAELP